MVITIRDVARQAGVSLGTVSNVLNNVPTVSKKNCDLVNAAIAQLGYRRNNAASLLRSNISNIIGLVIPDIANPFYPEIARGVEDTAGKANYSVFLYNKDRSLQMEEVAIEALLSKNVDGILLLKPLISANAIAEIRKHCVVVLMDTDPSLVDCDIVNADDYTGMCRAVKTVYDMGHKKIAFVSGRNDSFSSLRRQEAFKDTAAGFGLPENPEYIIKGDYSFESGANCFEQIMALQNPPTAVIAANDMMARGMIFKANKMGLKIPQDISIVGYDDINEAKWAIPALTTVWHPKYEMGQMAAKLLFKRIEQKHTGTKAQSQNILMETKFCMRETLSAIE